MDVTASLHDIWEAAKLAGPFGAMLALFMWWRSDNERRGQQKQLEAYLERTLNAISEIKEAIRENSKAILTAVRKD